LDGLWRFDQTVFKAVHQGWHAGWLDPVFWVISTTGLGWVQGLFLFIIGFKWPKFPEVRYEWLWPVAWAGIFTGVTNNLLKQFFERERPSNYIWADPQESIYFSSYPSGHTAGSFGLAFAFCFLAPVSSRWKAVVMGWACLVGLSRIYRGVHWPTDVLGGIGNGLFCACLALMLWRLMRGHAASAAIETSA
jgi:undecaprenyl-diphosphatase